MNPDAPQPQPALDTQPELVHIPLDSLENVAPATGKTYMNGGLPENRGYTTSDIAPILKMMSSDVYDVNIANGWFDDDRSDGDSVALIHSEVSELLEDLRDGLFGRYLEFKVGQIEAPNGETLKVTQTLEFDDESVEGYTQLYGPGKPVGDESECADILIRLLDHVKRNPHIDLARGFIEKLQYNATRGYKHGGKTL